jgi:hypothetical protein
MNALVTALQEVYGLFVEDGSLTLALLVWIAIAAFLFPHVPGGASWRAPVLFLGIALLLLENVLRSARK